MNIVRSWREQKAMLKRIFPILSDEDLAFKKGERENMLIKLETKLNKSRGELELIFSELQRFYLTQHIQDCLSEYFHTPFPSY